MNQCYSFCWFVATACPRMDANMHYEWGQTIGFAHVDVYSTRHLPNKKMNCFAEQYQKWKKWDTMSKNESFEFCKQYILYLQCTKHIKTNKRTTKSTHQVILTPSALFWWSCVLTLIIIICVTLHKTNFDFLHYCQRKFSGLEFTLGFLDITTYSQLTVRRAALWMKMLN